MKKLISAVISLAICVMCLPVMRQKEANAGILTEKVLLWQCSVDCIYWDNGYMEYGYRLLFMDDDWDEYWISNRACPAHLLSFNPMFLQAGTQVKVNKSVLNNSTYFIHCT